MAIDVALLVLLAAVLHAGWNALIKISGDRIAVMAVVTLAGSLWSMLALPFVDSPDPASWHLLALSVLIHTGYHFFLSVAYDHGDLGQVYPIARGVAPILVTLGALIFVGETVGHFALMGILCLAVGVMALALEGREAGNINPKAVYFALATGACIAGYTVVDGVGARQAGSVLGFAIWLTIGNGILTFLIALMWKRREISVVVKRNPLTGLFGGAMQVGAYWIIVFALAVAPMGMVSGLRETSVLFAALISTFLLKEGFGVWRFVSATLVTFGLVVSRVKN